jgi:hypothetical protein
MGKVWEWITGGIAHLIASLKLAASTLVGKVLGAFGLTIISLEALLPPLKAFVLSHVQAIPPQVMQLVGALGIGEAISMILSALTVRLATKTMIVPKSVADTLPSAVQHP